MKAPTMKQALTDLRGKLCPCGGQKTSRQTFCRGDYFRLPVGMREALYDRAGQGYEEAYGRALEFLKLASTAAATQRRRERIAELERQDQSLLDALLHSESGQ